MFQKSTKIIVIIGVLFFIVSASALAIFFRTVTNQKINFNEQNIARAQAQYHQDSLATLMRTLDETKAERDGLFSRILKEEGVIDFLALIESLGKEQGATLTTNSLTVVPINDLFETLVVNVSVEGSYDSVMSVLKLLEHLPYQATIAKVQIGRDGGAQGSLWGSTYEVRITKFKRYEI